MRRVVGSPAGSTIAVVIFFIATTLVCGYETKTLTLKMLTPPSHELNLTQLRAIDSARHERLLQSPPVHGTFNFPVAGGTDPIFRLYYTTLKLGTPPKEFNVMIDTGSDLLWVSCISCVGCPQTGNVFDPGASSSAVKFPCSDKRCNSNLKKKSGCSPYDSCSYQMEYADGSVTSGYYISDVMSFDSVISSNLTIKSSAPFVFGCSDLQGGHLSEPDTPIHGIVGLGKGHLSLLSQLSAQTLAPLVFSHCLSGGKDGGGVMVLGENRMPNTVYTPLVPSQTHYNVDLQSIAVNDMVLPIDPSVFSVATGSAGTVVDSGTTLVLFPVEAYDPLIQAISNAVLRYGQPITSDGFQCYNITSGISSYQRVADMFPEVSLGFAGGASMVLKPEAYLFQSVLMDSLDEVPCIAFQTRTLLSGSRITIIGEVALRDKMVVYDLDHQRIGWAEYNCSLDVTRGEQNKDVINTWQARGKSTKGGHPSSCLLQALMIHLLLHFMLSH